MRKNKTNTPAIAFILNFFPILSETFIISEIQNLLSRGMRIDLYSLFYTDKYEKRNDLGDLEKQVQFLQPLLKPVTLAVSHISFFVKHPLKYINTLVFALCNRNERSIIKTIFRFVKSSGKNRHELSKKDRQNIFIHFILCMPFAIQIDKGDYRLVHAHYADTAASFAMLIGKLCGIPFSFTTHATDLFVNPFYLDLKVKHAKFVVTCTEYNKNYIVNHFIDLKSEKIVVNYHGVDTAYYTTKGPRNNAVPMILSVGRLVPKKGFDILIRACRILYDNGVKFTCHIIGRGPEMDNLQKLISDNHLEECVILTGPMSPVDVKTFYAKADVFALPCRITPEGDRDGIPNVLAEAMAMEMAAVSTNVSGIPEILHDGVSGYVCEPNDPEQIADKLLVLLNDPELRITLGRSARALLLEIFDKKQKIDELVEIFGKKMNDAENR